MRVILLMNSVFTGGAEFSSLCFHGWLRKQGHEVRVVVLKKVSPAYDVTRFGFDAVTVLTGSSSSARLRAFHLLTKEFQPHIVHSVLFEANLLGRLSRIAKRNFIHIESLVNEMYSEHRYADPQVTRFKLTAYRLLDWITQGLGVDHYHANGESVARHYQQKLFISANRITVIPRGREANPWVGDQENRNLVRRDWKTGSRLLLINMARHEYQKGQDVLMEALALLGDDRDKLHVVIVGRAGKLTPVLNKKIEQHHLQEVVTLVGHQDEVSKLLAAADGFVFPSRFEGLPGALIEAEAAGLSILCSDIPNNREVALDQNAFFFPVDDAAALATQLRLWVNDAGLRASMGRASSAHFEKHFTLNSIHQRMLVLFDKLLTRQ